jgi:tyrosine-protein kinase
VIVLCVCLGVGAALAQSMRQEKLYRSSADVFLNAQNLGFAVANTYTPYVDPVRAGATQADLAGTPVVAERAAKLARIPGRTGPVVLGETVISAAGGADLLSFSVTDHDANAAARLATAYARAYTSYRRILDNRSLISARNEIQRRLDELQASGDEKSALYASLSDKLQQLRTLEVLQGANVLYVRPAQGASQIQPQPQRNAILGGILGLVLGIGLAFLLDALNTRVRTTDEVEERLEIPLLGRLPLPSRRLRSKEQLQMLEEPQAPEGEAYQILATNLEFANIDRGARTIMITSAKREEGKSTTAANLAVALARAGRRVVLVDLDLRRPSLHRYFSIEAGAGLTQVLLGHASVGDVLVPVPIVDARPGRSSGNGAISGLLEVLPAGVVPPNPAELARSHALSQLLGALEKSSDIVIIDSPPLIGLSDTATLSAKVDALLLVVKLSDLRRPVLNELARLLEGMPVVRIGFAASDTQSETGYGYGYGYSYREPKRRRARQETPR